MSEILQRIASFCNSKRAILLVSLMFACVTTLTLGTVAASAKAREGLFIRDELLGRDYREADSYDFMVDKVDMYSLSYYNGKGFELAGQFINGEGLFIRDELLGRGNGRDCIEADGYDFIVDKVCWQSLLCYGGQGFELAGQFQ
jgi:hypothetical protein